MGEFNYKKFLTENKLTHSSREVSNNKKPSDNFIDVLTEVWVENILEERNILKENLNENFLKNLYNKVKGKVKGISPEKLKGVEDNIEDAGYDSKEVMKDASNVAKELPKGAQLSPEVLARIKQLSGPNVQTEAKKDQEEEPKGENKGEISNIEDLKSLSKTQPDTFKWVGEDNPKAEWNGQSIQNDETEVLDYIYNLSAKGKEEVAIPGLIKGKTYEVIPEFKEEGYPAQPSYLITAEIKDEVAKEAGGGWIGKFQRKYPKLLKIGKVGLGILGIASVATGLTGDTVQTGPGLANLPDAIDDAGSDMGDMGMDQADTGPGDAGNVTTIPTTADNSTDDGTVDKVQQSYDANNVDIGDTNLDNTDTNSSAVQTHDVGEYEVDSGQKSEIVKDLVNQTLEDLNGQLEDLKGKNVTSINLDIDFGGTISNQGDGGASNQADGGGDLLDGRTSTAEDISKQAGEQLTKIIQNALGDNVEVNINYNSVDTHDSYGDQSTQKATDNLGTQSSFETVTVGDIGAEDIPQDEPQEDPPDLMYQYLFNKRSPKDDPGKTKDQTKPAAPSPEEPKGDPITLIKSGKFGDLNRNNQIATILKTIKDDLNIYDKLGESGLGDIKLTGDLKQIIQNDKASEELKKLAKLIIAIRKNPNSFLKRVSSATGVELDTRAKAKTSKPGAKEKGMYRSGSVNEIEIIHPFNELLLEGLIDDLVKPEDIKSKKFEILALVGSMYASTTQKNNNRLSIVDPEKLSDEDRKKLKGLGFVHTKSGDYYFLDDEGKTTTKSGEEDPKDPQQPTTLDPTDKEVSKDIQRIQKTISKKTDLLSKLKLINDKEELQQLIKSMIVYINPQFQKNPSQIRSAMFKARNRFKVPEKQKLRTEIRFKRNLNFLIGILSEAEEKIKPDVDRSIDKIDQYGDLKNQMKLIGSMEELVEFILDVILPNVNPALLKRPADIKGALVGAGNAAGKVNENKYIKNKTMKKSEFRALIREQIKRTLREAAIEPPSDGGDTESPSKNGAPEKGTMTITDLGNKFLQISKDLKGSKIKGLESSELKTLDVLLDKILQASQEGSATALMQRMDRMVK